MNYLAVKDLKAPRYVREQLNTYGAALVLNNGKPMALMLNIRDEEDPETLLEAIGEARARMALSRLRTEARRQGRATMSGAQINAEIAAVRRARRTAP